MLANQRWFLFNLDFPLPINLFIITPKTRFLPMKDQWKRAVIFGWYIQVILREHGKENITDFFFDLFPNGEENLDYYKRSYKFANKLVHFSNWNFSNMLLNVSEPFHSLNLYLIRIHLVSPILSLALQLVPHFIIHIQGAIITVYSRFTVCCIKSLIQLKRKWHPRDHNLIHFVISIDLSK